MEEDAYTLSEDEIRARLEDEGLEVDSGNLISGPFIPDGTTRIYERETNSLVSSGSTLQDAYEQFLLYRRGHI